MLYSALVDSAAASSACQTKPFYLGSGRRFLLAMKSRGRLSGVGSSWYKLYGQSWASQSSGRIDTVVSTVCGAVSQT